MAAPTIVQTIRYRESILTWLRAQPRAYYPYLTLLQAVLPLHSQSDKRDFNWALWTLTTNERLLVADRPLQRRQTVPYCDYSLRPPLVIHERADGNHAVPTALRRDSPS